MPGMVDVHRQSSVVAFTPEERQAIADALTTLDLELRSKRRFYRNMGQSGEAELVSRRLLVVHLAQAKVGVVATGENEEPKTT